MGPGVRYWEQQKPELKGSTRSQKTVCSIRPPPAREKWHLCTQIDSPRHVRRLLPKCFRRAVTAQKMQKGASPGIFYTSAPGGDGNDSHHAGSAVFFAQSAAAFFRDAARHGEGNLLAQMSSLSLSLFWPGDGSNILFAGLCCSQ